MNSSVVWVIKIDEDDVVFEVENLLRKVMMIEQVLSNREGLTNVGGSASIVKKNDCVVIGLDKILEH